MSTLPTQFTQPGERTLFGHPMGLFLLFLVEMWERFSYYGMRGLLVLYLVRATTGDEQGFNPGRGWSKAEASTLYGWYTGLAYLTPIVGGVIADKLIGTHRSMVFGGLIIALGHIVLAISGIGDMAHNDLGMSVFIFGLAIIVIGTGHFKPSVSVMVGQLYKEGDPRRDGAFTIFYMGINLGAFLCAFVCGTLGEKVGWHWGFGSAAVGMIAGLLLYLAARPKLLGTIGDPPGNKGGTAPLFLLMAVAFSALFAFAYHTKGLQSAYTGLMGSLTGATGWAVVIGLGLVVLTAAGWFVAIQKPGDKGPTASIFIFMFFNAFFWIAFEQAGSSINLFTEEKTDRFLFGWEVPATWFQSVNAGLIFILAPWFAGLWSKLNRRNANPSQPVKIALGLIFLGLGYIFMVWAGLIAKDATAKASMMLILLTYFWHTVGELCLSPTGLSYVTKAAPVRFVSLLMGIWFISSFIANLGGGLIASTVEKIESGEMKLPWYSIKQFGGQADYFFLFVVTSVGAGLVILLFTPLLKKLLRHTND
ncbi:MAG: peptide MFS transporter [Phycisphaerae bacterium]|nr:peptide MFS transporter [Phycisphaerae bacterium]